MIKTRWRRKRAGSAPERDACRLTKEALIKGKIGGWAGARRQADNESNSTRIPT